MMSGGRKPVQAGVRVKLPAGVTGDRLAAVIQMKSASAASTRRLHALASCQTGNQRPGLPDRQIDEIRRKESRDLRNSMSTSIFLIIYP